MIIRFLLLTTLLCSSILLAKGNERSVEDIREEAQEHLEDGYDKASLGAVGVGYGILNFSRGDPVHGAVSVGLGAGAIKESLKDFKKAKELFADAREQESRQDDPYDPYDHDQGHRDHGDHDPRDY